MVDLPVGMTPWKFASENKYMEKAYLWRQQKFTCDDDVMGKTTYLWGQHNGNLLVMMMLWRRQLTRVDRIMEISL